MVKPFVSRFVAIVVSVAFFKENNTSKGFALLLKSHHNFTLSLLSKNLSERWLISGPEVLQDVKVMARNMIEMIIEKTNSFFFIEIHLTKNFNPN